LAALNNPAVNIRYLAARKLAEQREHAMLRLIAMARGADWIAKARALALLAQMGPQGVAVVEEAATAGRTPEVRIAAFRALRSADERVMDTAAKLASDASPAVRREVAVALRDVRCDDCKD